MAENIKKTKITSRLCRLMLILNHTYEVALQKIKTEFDQAVVSYLPISDYSEARRMANHTTGMQLVKFRLTG